MGTKRDELDVDISNGWLDTNEFHEYCSLVESVIKAGGEMTIKQINAATDNAYGGRRLMDALDTLSHIHAISFGLTRYEYREPRIVKRLSLGEGNNGFYRNATKAALERPAYQPYETKKTA